MYIDIYSYKYTYCNINICVFTYVCINIYNFAPFSMKPILDIRFIKHTYVYILYRFINVYILIIYTHLSMNKQR